MSGKDKEPVKLLKSFDYALKGLLYAVRTQRNMKIHIIIAVLVLIVSLFLNISRFELIAIIFAISLVLISEILNTALELIINLITEEHHPLAKIIKDLTAGAVFFSSLCAVFVGYLVFVKKEVIEIMRGVRVIEKVAAFPLYIVIVIIVLVLAVSIGIKILKEKQPSIEGGLPSIHAAVAFSLATITYFLSSSGYVLLVSIMLAAMVAQSRIHSRIHSLWEVIAGAVLGGALTLLIFQLIV